MTRVAVIGAGRMGLGIAEALLLGGVRVVLADATPELTRAAPERLAARMRAHAEAGLIDAHVDGVEVADGSVAAAGADFVIECVTEDIGVKEGVLRACEAAAPAEAIVASNTSALDMEALASFFERPERFLGMHFFNPPEWTPGVELVVASATSAETVERAAALLRDIGKHPCVVAPGVGFIANRLQMAMFCEAARCVEEGLSTPSEVDDVVRSCFGFRLPFFGPFQIADMAGLDVYQAVIEEHEQRLGERFRVPEALRRLVGEGRRGTASGAGFYEYHATSPERVLLERDRAYAALGDLLERRSRGEPR
jgi:3-hydroxybutyryl-CoA dehydrogenase